ncbi:MAG: glycogen-binding domain-containing protein [Longimicrobiales bacterium]|nr:glycogen-binding domain-containing protein [Longimicrobiales bacterium]
MRAAAAVLLALFASSGAELRGQEPRWGLDLNASRIQFDTAATLNAPSATGLLEWRRPRLFGRLTGSLTGFQDAGWSTQGRGDVAGWLTPFGAASPFRLELAGTVGASRHSSGFSASLGRANARLHLARRDFGGWAGAGGVMAGNSLDTEAVTAVAPTVGLWGQTGSVRATVSYVHTTLSGEVYPEGNAVLAVSEGSLDLTLYGGFRTFPFEGIDPEGWAGASAALWVGRTTAVVISGGSYASDILQGLPGGDFISVGLRLTSRRDRPIPTSVDAPIVYSADIARERRITLTVPDADRVEIAGDFNGWTPEPLRRVGDGEWAVPVELAPGVYRFNLRVDGERWIVPDGVPEVDDGYGDTVGLLIISPNQ